MAVVAASLASCVAPSTPDQRIAARPLVYDKLSNKEKDSVKLGQLIEGMSKDGVSLAWGSPSNRVIGLREGKDMERWDYSGSRPIVSNSFYGGFGSGRFGRFGRGGFGRGGYGYGGYGGYGGGFGGFGQTVTYVPVRSGSVWFVDGRVNEWERYR